MSGNSLLLDTNIILYYLAGDNTLTPLMEENKLFVSVITEIELLSFHSIKSEEIHNIRTFLNFCSVKNISDEIKEKAIKIRREFKMKLPDAIILASALTLQIPLITSDNDFKEIEHADIIFYEK